MTDSTAPSALSWRTLPDGKREIITPPIRQLLRPDPGYCLIDVDLERADVHIVAWEAGAANLKAILKSGADVHLANATQLFGESLAKGKRQVCKAGIHAIDYYCKPRTLAITLGCTVAEAEDFIRRYFVINPEIPQWHRRVGQEIRFKRQIRNVWGFRRFYFDRLDNILPQALAWLGSSPVAPIINKGMLNLDCARQLVGRERCGHCLECQEPGSIRLILQVHDSLLLQTPIERCPAIFPEIVRRMRVEVPFKDDPLIIPISLKYSTRSWGEVKSWKLGEEFRATKEAA